MRCLSQLKMLSLSTRHKCGLNAILTERDPLNETANAMSLSIGNAFVANETQMWIECNFDRVGPFERDCECDLSHLVMPSLPTRRRCGLSAILTERDHLNETVNAMSLSIGNAFVANETQMWIECNFDRAAPLERDCECDVSLNWKCLRCQ